MKPDAKVQHLLNPVLRSEIQPRFCARLVGPPQQLVSPVTPAPSPGLVPANILDHLQIPQFRLVVQIRLPVLGAPGKHPLFRPADTQCWLTCIALGGALIWSSGYPANGRS